MTNRPTPKPEGTAHSGPGTSAGQPPKKQKPGKQEPKSKAARIADKKALRWALLRQLLLTTGLVVLWIMLWDAWSVVHIVAGIIVAVIVTRLFYLPPIELSGRINPWYFAVYLAWFAGQLVRGALEVAAVALRPRKTAPGSVIAVDLHTRSDLLITVIAQTAGLIPGTFVTEVDRARGVIFLHVLDCNTDEQIERARELALEIEVHVIKAIGSEHDIHVLNESRIAQGQKPVLGGRTMDDLKAKQGAEKSGATPTADNPAAGKSAGAENSREGGA